MNANLTALAAAALTALHTAEAAVASIRADLDTCDSLDADLLFEALYDAEDAEQDARDRVIEVESMIEAA